jgi:hypothetical protein
MRVKVHDFEEDSVSLIDPASDWDDAVWKLSLERSSSAALVSQSKRRGPFDRLRPGSGVSVSIMMLL